VNKKQSRAMERDERFMREALRLARRGRGNTHPNPMVGAVLVRRGEIVGRGYHQRAGAPHAEVNAIADAGKAAKGADLYVNLEPCNHHGKTPPCTKAVLQAGVRRVVVGMIDPNPLVNGAGLHALEKAGVAVRAGVLKRECEQLNAAFAVFIREGRPHFRLKSAATLDGHVATGNGHSRWITGQKARAVGHRFRADSDAILVGVGTVLADDPELTCRHVRGRDPLRVVVDSQLRTPLSARVVAQAREGSSAKTMIVTTRKASAQKARQLQQCGVEVVRVSSQKGRVSLAGLTDALAARKIVSVLVEAGPTLSGALWKEQLVDEIAFFYAPKILGDASGLPMIAGPRLLRMDQSARLDDARLQRCGEDFLVTGRVRYELAKKRVGSK
jgi:diaminohydroxyphosphoribosylaminopyrimidine deaminase/5-amino-6-(5-phosphoribosylamino)uracil reductase